MYQEGDRVLAAVSGGADSVCMLLMLKKYLPEGTLGAAHFNHGLRGDESDRDESFVKDLCAKLEVPFFSEKADISAAAAAEKSGIEECARKYRYEFLNRVAEKERYNYICVAHNRGDNAETVFMHILRGCSVDGLAGMPYRAGNIIRPLLDIDRREIAGYLRLEGQDFITDSSNADNTYLRNRVRNVIIPFISDNVGYDFRDVLVRQTGIAADERDYLDADADAFIVEHVKECPEGLIADKEKLEMLHPGAGRRVIRNIISMVKDGSSNSPYEGRKDINSDAVLRVYEVLKSGKLGKTAECGRGVKMRLTHSGALFYCDNNAGETYCPRTDGGLKDNDEKAEYSSEEKAGFAAEELTFGETEKIKAEKGFSAGERFVYFDKNKYIDIIHRCGNGAPVFRHPEAGDVISPFGMQGKKKVRKLLIDLKIPYEKRSGLKLLAAGREVLWIPGICSSELLRIDEKTAKIIRVVIREDN